MYIERPIDILLLEWKNSSRLKPLLLRGARQVGKTYSVREFGKNYQSFIEVNFITQPYYKQLFSEGYATDMVIKQMSLLNPLASFVPGDTLIFFDEMQEYPDCATSLKFFKEDGRYDVVCSSSMGVLTALSPTLAPTRNSTSHSLTALFAPGTP